MRNKKFSHLIVLFLSIFVILFLLSSCAGIRDESQGFDDTFGGENLDDIDDQVLSDLDASSDEAEVLRLLGITEEDSQTMAQSEASESTTNVPTRETDISSQVENLEEEAKNKDVELSNLKAELAERDRRIQELQNELSNPRTSLSSGAPPGSFQAKYEDALTTYRNRSYKQAIQKFEDLLAVNANNSLVDNCQYWKGECYYALGDYNQAILEFQKVFTFSNSNKLDSAQLKLGLCYLRLGNRERARSEFEKLVSNYPDSEYISRAQTYLSRL
ncbi:tetratricopeptide repeat protein [candidate division KSB1 bacterium]|nr:tetratricopeptide repeat protein [candidate division KSB1 bacterium]